MLKIILRRRVLEGQGRGEGEKMSLEQKIEVMFRCAKKRGRKRMENKKNAADTFKKNSFVGARERRENSK